MFVILCWSEHQINFAYWINSDSLSWKTNFTSYFSFFLTMQICIYLLWSTQKNIDITLTVCFLLEIDKDNLLYRALNITSVHTAAKWGEAVCSNYAAFLISTPAVLLIKVWGTGKGWRYCASLQPQPPLLLNWRLWCHSVKRNWSVYRYATCPIHLYSPNCDRWACSTVKESGVCVTYLLLHRPFKYS